MSTVQQPAAQPAQPIVITSPTSVSYTVEHIDPSTAAVYLSLNASNRKIRPLQVKSYARDMSEGLWSVNGDTICFDKDGKLADGQHRLSAIIESGVTVPMMVVRGLDPDSQKTMDTGPSRTSADVFGFAGHKEATSLALAAKMGLNYYNGDFPKAGSRAAKYSHIQLLNFTDENPKLIDALEFVKDYRNVGISRGTAAFAFFHLSQIDEDDAVDMFESIMQFKTDGKGDPVHAFCTKMSRYKNSKNVVFIPTQELYMLFRVWNAYRADENLINIRFNSTTPFAVPK